MRLKKIWLLNIAVYLFAFSLIGSAVFSQEEEYPTPPPQDGLARCINDKRRPDKTYPDKAHTSCPCWGTTDANNPNYRVCPKPQGEDTKCTNHCKATSCDCKSHCQS